MAPAPGLAALTAGAGIITGPIGNGLAAIGTCIGACTLNKIGKIQEDGDRNQAREEKQRRNLLKSQNKRAKEDADRTRRAQQAIAQGTKSNVGIGKAQVKATTASTDNLPQSSDDAAKAAKEEARLAAMTPKEQRRDGRKADEIANKNKNRQDRHNKDALHKQDKADDKERIRIAKSQREIQRWDSEQKKQFPGRGYWDAMTGKSSKKPLDSLSSSTSSVRTRSSLRSGYSTVIARSSQDGAGATSRAKLKRENDRRAKMRAPTISMAEFKTRAAVREQKGQGKIDRRKARPEKMTGKPSEWGRGKEYRQGLKDGHPYQRQNSDDSMGRSPAASRPQSATGSATRQGSGPARQGSTHGSSTFNIQNPASSGGGSQSSNQPLLPKPSSSAPPPKPTKVIDSKGKVQPKKNH